MEILKHGQLPENRHYRGACPRCGCEVRCKRSEVAFDGDPRGSQGPTVACPTEGCGARIDLAPEKPPRNPATPLRTGYARPAPRANCVAGGPPATD